jgi:hypothetical protein
MAAYRLKFTVKGKGFFPLDMLRYDKCYPMNPRDIDLITERGQMPERMIVIGTVIVGSKAHVTRLVKEGLTPTVGRWLSMGWPVVSEVNIRRVEM